MMHGAGFAISWFGLLLMLFFWIGLIFIAVWIGRSLFRGGSPARGSRAEEEHTIKEILDQRYARGEITREQYEMMKRDLM
jgi:putative membrane protein